MRSSESELARSLFLYAVTDRSWLADDETLGDALEEAIGGGVTFVQVREKHLDHDSFVREARGLKELCWSHGVPFVVNDDVEVALAVDADGVHVGQSDMACAKARELLGPEKIVGVSAETVEEARLAEADGADYLGVGAVFPTGSKDDAEVVGVERLKDICAAVSIPVVAIGGLTLENLGELAGTGIAGIAVISAIFAQKNKERAAADLNRRLEEVLRA